MEIVRQADEQAMLELIDVISRHGLTRDEVRERKRQGGGQDREARRPFVFRYEPPGRGFRVSLRFEREDVDSRELLTALEEVVAELRAKLAESGEGTV